MDRQRPWLVPLLMVSAVVLSVLLFRFTYLHDNKFTAPRPAARDGVARLDTALLDRSDPVHLVDGWEFYRYKLLEPKDIPAHIPDAYLYIGQYGGFDLGDGAANPHGEGTYRLTLLADHEPRVYCLELPEIYSAYRLWINGDLLAQMGTVGPESYLPHTADSFVTFTASDKIEIVVAVSDYTHFYSGMVHPPAFGSPQAVRRILILRLLIHGAACTAAMLLGIFCLILGATRKSSRSMKVLALLCLCMAGYAGYPIIHNIGLTGELWYSLERVSRQIMTICLIILTGSLCGVSKRVYRAAAMLGLPFVLLSMHPHMLFNGMAESLYLVSRLLTLWQWTSALFLAAAGIWGIRQGTVRSVPLLAGGLVYACALVIDRMYPVYEPVLGGRRVETAGFVLLFVVFGVLWRDMVLLYRENLLSQEQRRFAQERLDMQLEASRLEREYVEKAHRLRHELRGHFAVMRVYMGKEEYGKADAYAASLLEESAEPGAVGYSENRLLNAILTAKFNKARSLGVNVEWKLSKIPAELPVEDRDLSSLVTNILDNAVEACARVEPPSERWIALDMRLAHGLLVLDCRNSRTDEAKPRTGGRLAARRKREGRGYGLSIIREIAERYGGLADTDLDSTTFSIHVALNLQAVSGDRAELFSEIKDK